MRKERKLAIGLFALATLLGVATFMLMPARMSPLQAPPDCQGIDQSGDGVCQYRNDYKLQYRNDEELRLQRLVEPRRNDDELRLQQLEELLRQREVTALVELFPTQDDDFIRERSDFEAIRQFEQVIQLDDNVRLRAQSILRGLKNTTLACIDRPECLAACARDHTWGLADCPTEEDVTAKRLREAYLAYSAVPDEVTVERRFRVAASAVARDEPVTAQSKAARVVEQNVGAEPRADDNAAVRGVREFFAPPDAPAVITKGADVLPYLEAILTGDGFVIEPVSGMGRRNCQIERTCAWDWSVKPVEPGARTLTVTINGFLSNDPTLNPIPLDTDVHQIFVHVAPEQKKRNLVEKPFDWTSFWTFVGALGTVLGAISAVILGWRKELSGWARGLSGKKPSSGGPPQATGKTEQAETTEKPVQGDAGAGGGEGH